jgi:hypothetical protein
MNFKPCETVLIATAVSRALKKNDIDKSQYEN